MRTESRKPDGAQNAIVSPTKSAGGFCIIEDESDEQEKIKKKEKIVLIIIICLLRDFIPNFYHKNN